MPYLGSGLGNGALVELADGSVKYDLIAGIGVHFLGHSQPALIDAAVESALRDTIMQGNLMQNEEALELSEQLLEIANRNHADLSHCFLTTSGAMANENALKIALQHRFPADRVFAFEGGFSGRTLALSRITDRPAYRVGLPATLKVDYIPFFNPDQPEPEYCRRIGSPRRLTWRASPAATPPCCSSSCLAKGAAIPGDRAFFLALMERLRQAGITVIIDEIQTFGRTPAPFAFQYFGLDDFADIVTVGKLTQVCATLFRKSFNPAPGLISQTFIGATSAIFAARVILEMLDQRRLLRPNG